jgi:hypothetical protein
VVGFSAAARSIYLLNSDQGARRFGRGANHSLPSSADAENEWSCTSNTPYTFMAGAKTTFIFFLSFLHFSFRALQFNYNNLNNKRIIIVRNWCN